MYSSPVEHRIKSANRNIESIKKALAFILEIEDDKFFEIKSFVHTTYGAHKILSYWFEFHHSSITLKEPLTQIYNASIEAFKNNEFTTKEEKKDFEYSTYLVASTLLDIDFDDFSRYHELINLVENDNYYVQGLIDSDFNSKQKTLGKEDKKRKNIKKFEKRLSFIDRDKVEDNVNISIKDRSKTRKFKKQ